MRGHVKTFLIYFLLFCFAITSANANGYTFIDYSTSEGLVHKSVYCIYRDKDGFLWIGTSSGLSRFDGYQFRNYVHEKAKPLSINGSSIHAIVEGTDTKIWLSTDAGLEYFDKKTESFHLVTLFKNNNNYFDVNLDVDDKGNIWLYNYEQGFTVFNPVTNKIIKQYSLKELTVNKQDINLNRFKVFGNKILISTNKGIFICNIQNKRTQVLTNSPTSFCRAIQKVGDNIILTFMFEGVMMYNLVNQTSTLISLAEIEKKIKIKTFLYDAIITSDSTLWIATSTGAVAIKNKITTFYNQVSRDNYFEGDIVSCLHVDGEENIWFGTYSKGFLFKKKEKSTIKLASKLYKDDVNKSIISYISTFDDGSLVYTDNRSVYRCNNYKQLMPDCAEKIYDESNATLLPIDGRYCFINCIDTLILYDSQTRKLKRLLFNRSTSSACFGKNGTIWVSSWVGTVNGYDKNGNLQKTIYVDPIKKSWIQIYTIAADADGSLWLGTFGEGLVHVLHPESGNPLIISYKKKENDKSSIQSNIIHSFFIKGEKIWIATNGGGLSVFDKKKNSFTTYTTENGLKSNIIESVVADKTGNIWFASTVISKFDPIKNTFSHYTKADGVIGNLSAKGGVVTFDGSVLFPGTEGIYIINPRNIAKKQEAKMPVLTELRLRGIQVNAGDTIDGEIPYKQSISCSDTLLLTYKTNSFSILFASLQFQESQALSYAYKLSGIDRDWIPSDYKNRTASYSGLQPGKYIFKVKATTDGNVWSKEKTLVIFISPPWWRTWTFYILAFLLCIGILWYSIRSRFAEMKRQNQLLENKVKERTEELVVINDQLKEQQKIVELKNVQLNEVIHSKDELISVLGHDFRNPLSGLLGVATMLRAESQKTKLEKIKHYSEVILASSQTLMSQMTSVLDWAQGHNQILEATPIEINIEMLLNDTISLVADSAVLKDIRISTQTDFQTNAFVDPRMISTVFRNLLSNAIEFTPKGGSIVIMIHEFEKIIDITFIDTGIGIDKSKQKKLFYNYQKTHSTFGTENEKGTGLGLQICKTFVEKNGGKIGFSSEPGKGTVFTVSLPKGKLPAIKIIPFVDKPDDQQFLVSSEYNGTVLIIEDNPDISDVINNLFVESHKCITTRNGEEGLFLAQKSLPDIIICDINLPGISGLEICKILKTDSNTAHIPILMMSSQISVEIEQECFINGANDFITKPFDLTTLKLKIQGLLELRKKIIEQFHLKLASTKESDIPVDNDTKIVHKVVEYIQNNLADTGMDTETIADKFGISRAQLWRIFKNSTGKSLGDCIKTIRMQKAAEMLKTGKFRISEIAYEVGFVDPKYFTKCFVKEYGVSPKSFAEKPEC